MCMCICGQVCGYLNVPIYVHFNMYLHGYMSILVSAYMPVCVYVPACAILSAYVGYRVNICLNTIFSVTCKSHNNQSSKYM